MLFHTRQNLRVYIYFFLLFNFYLVVFTFTSTMLMSIRSRYIKVYMGGVDAVTGTVEAFEAVGPKSSSSSSFSFSSFSTSFSGSLPVRARYFFLIESQSTTLSILVALLKDNWLPKGLRCTERAILFLGRTWPFFTFESHFAPILERGDILPVRCKPIMCTRDGRFLLAARCFQSLMKYTIQVVIRFNGEGAVVVL